MLSKRASTCTIRNPKPLYHFLCMISILCSFSSVRHAKFLDAPKLQFDDGYLAIFLRQLSRRGLLLFYCSQLSKVDGVRHAHLFCTPTTYTQKMLVARRLHQKHKENNYCTPQQLSGLRTAKRDIRKIDVCRKFFFFKAIFFQLCTLKLLLW